MKKNLLLVFIVALLNSCSTGEVKPDADEDFCSGQIDPGEEQFPQTWTLVKMSGSIKDSEATGTKMAWQEVITLTPDKTFLKTRVRNSKTSHASGIFTMEKNSVDSRYELILSYPSEGELLGSCQSQELREVYILESNCKLTGTWSACDGPGLEYKRQFNN